MLKLICDVPLSKFAFNFNLRRYTKVVEQSAMWLKVGHCRLTPSNPR